MNAPPSVWDLEGTHREGPAAAASGAGVRSSRSRRPPSCPARSARGASRGRQRGEGERELKRGAAVARTAAERQQGARQKLSIVAGNYRGEPRDAGNRRTIPTAAGAGPARRGAELRGCGASGPARLKIDFSPQISAERPRAVQCGPGCDPARREAAATPSSKLKLAPQCLARFLAWNRCSRVFASVRNSAFYPKPLLPF